MKAVIELQGVGVNVRQSRSLFRRSQAQLLSQVDLLIHQGETLGVIGSNGAGKSTLLKIIAGIQAPSTGKVIQDQDTRAALMSLNAGFIASLSAEDNLKLYGALQGASGDAIKELIPTILAYAGLSDEASKLVGHLSNGMKARLGFSAAMHFLPDLVLIDEVLGVGDQAFREMSSRDMHQFIASGKTVVLVSHNLATLEQLCDRLLWLEQGQVKMLGATAEVLAAYRN